VSSWQSKALKLGFQTGRRSLYRGHADIQALRIAMDRVAAPLIRWTDLQVEEVTAAGVPAAWAYTDGAPERPVVLYLHGGGYCVGSIVTHCVLAGNIARSAQARALVLDYRLAPEHPYPAAVEDSVAAYDWLLSQGCEPGQVVLAGDSAGGGLVLATLLALRDAGAPLPAAAVCLSPWIDLSLSGQSIAGKAEDDFLLTEDVLRVFAQHYLGDTDPRHPLVSPLYADLSGLPPLLIQVGTSEILLDDARRLAERAQSAGGEVVLDVWDEMVHVWQAYAAFVPEAREAIEQIGAFVIAHSGLR
jgi:monoterpene epsilon-lactone hydrolase